VASIILSTLNARFTHASLGLRYLLANMGDLEAETAIREFTINDAPGAIAEKLLAEQPEIIGFGVYIWNLNETTSVVSIIKRVAPRIRIIIGGPEVSFEYDGVPLVDLCDVLITGEADFTFRDTCRKLLTGDSPSAGLRASVGKVVASAKPDVAGLVFPYDRYSDDDLRQRIIYVEASRGCPYTCEFCLSSVDNGVRAFPLEPFLAQMKKLLERGCSTFKFVDRTFNLSPRVASAILSFFKDHWRDGVFLHFEMVPDRLPDAIKDLIAWFPDGAVQFEIGIQSFTPAVGELISRRMDEGRTAANLTWLKQHTRVHIHADLIIGLPGETLQSLGDSFDKLWWLRPHEIQVGILKRLKGTPIGRHAPAFGMSFNAEPPYDILQSNAFPFALMQRLKRFARYFELYVNSDKFARGIDQLIDLRPPSPFNALLEFSDWLWATTGQEHAISQKRLYELLGSYLIDRLGAESSAVIEGLSADFLAQGTVKYLPEFLRPAVEAGRRKARSPG
jgi:radical SAM superfamily enzyme YgiQ (UPF0313 family)